MALISSVYYSLVSALPVKNDKYVMGAHETIPHSEGAEDGPESGPHLDIVGRYPYNIAPNETPAVGTLREAVRFDVGNELIGGQKW